MKNTIVMTRPYFEEATAQSRTEEPDSYTDSYTDSYADSYTDNYTDSYTDRRRGLPNVYLCKIEYQCSCCQ